MRIDRRTDMTKIIVAFRNFAYAPKNTDFIDAVTAEVLRDLSFARNQPLKSAEVRKINH